MSKALKHKYRYLLLIPPSIVLLGIGVWLCVHFFIPESHQAKPTATTPFPTVTRISTADCAWSRYGEAWFDENADSLWNYGEPPLEGVEFYVDDILNGFTDIGRQSVSDWNGQAHIYVWLPGCPETRLEVYAVPPPGYRLTTDARLPVETTDARITVERYEDSDPFRFGFALLPGFSTPTPYVRGLTCEIYTQEARDIGIGPDGSVWAVSRNGVSQYDSVNGTWLAHYIDVPGIPDSFDDIAIGNDGVTWISNSYYGLMARLEESNWTTYTEERRLIPGSDPSIGTTPDGTVWFVLGEELVGFNPQPDSWKLYCGGWGSRCGAVYTAKAITDGSVWFGSSGEWSKYGPPDEAGPVEWEVSDRHVFAADEINKKTPITGQIEGAEIAPDGMIWIAHTFGVVSLDPQAEQWQAYDSTNTDGVLSTHVYDLAIAPDGSIWMASSGSGHSLAYRLIPATDEGEQDIWRTYDPRDGIPDLPEITNVAVGTDGAVWFGFTHMSRIARCMPLDQ